MPRVAHWGREDIKLVRHATGGIGFEGKEVVMEIVHGEAARAKTISSDTIFISLAEVLAIEAINRASMTA